MGGDWFNFNLVYGVEGFLDDHSPLIDENILCTNGYIDMILKTNETIRKKYGLSLQIYLVSDDVCSRWEGCSCDQIGISDVVVGWICPKFDNASELLKWEQNIKKEELDFVFKSINLRNMGDKAKYHNVYIWNL